MFSKKFKGLVVTILTTAMLFSLSTNTVSATTVENKATIYKEKEIQVELKLPAEEVGTNIETAFPNKKHEEKSNTIKPKSKPKPKPIKVSRGQQVANYAKKFNGGKYKRGGNSLKYGVDCSGFTTQIYKKFGVKLPRSSGAQGKVGKAVSLKNAKAGDLVCYPGHVAIYLGNNKVIHALNARSGIRITNINYTGKYKSIRRVL